jgi:hypothetical protein
MPKIIAAVVMMMGRSRTCAAVSSASRRPGRRAISSGKDILFTSAGE